MTAHTPNRRQFIQEISAGAAALALSQESFAVEPKPKGPNILFILVDQLRMDCLGAYGNPDIKTPNIDALAADGVRYNHSICAFPVCTPSRYSILSGQYVHEHRGWNNHCTLAEHIPTFPKILRAAEYRTKAVGKMHMAPTYLDVGFDEMLLTEQNGPGRWDDDYHRYLMELDLYDHNDLEDQELNHREHARKEYWDTLGALVSNLPDSCHSTTWVGDKTFLSLESWSEEGGNLVMASFIKPHHPFDPPAPWHEMYDPEKLAILPGWVDQCFPEDIAVSPGYFRHADMTEAQLRRAMAYYYATISHIDVQVGRLVGYLKSRGLYDNTLIVFTSDHGEYMGQRHLLLKANLTYESLLKVPLIIKWPGNKSAGEVSDRLVNNIDLAPTICAAAGCAPPASMSGEDLAQPGKREFLFAQGPHNKHTVIRDQKRKFIYFDDEAKKVEVRQFFDLEKDPWELNDVEGHPDYKEDQARLEKALEDWDWDGEKDIYLHYDEKQITGWNVPKDLSHRDAVKAYYAKKMGA